jgi:hypothetical protein
MKTKIIYISGTEVFDMREIRAAFDEVRSALGLAKDTILFGVPVDADDALSNTNTVAENTSISAVATETVLDDTAHKNITTEEPIIVDEIAPAPEKKSKKRATKEIKNEVAEVVPEVITTEEVETVIESVVEETVIEPVQKVVAETAVEEEPIIPILSILAAGADGDEEEQAPAAEDTVAVAAEEPVEEVAIVAAVVEDEVAKVQDVEPIDETDALQVSVGDIISTDAPVAEKEKTLEELLESMTPLREEVEEQPQDSAEIATDEEDINVDIDLDTETDATLAQLANEFAASQGKIVSIDKTEPQGKIGKLKNILPFKKAKRDDSSLMGDLFGWAGIAANDEDFSIPGFFTTAASKK